MEKIFMKENLILNKTEIFSLGALHQFIAFYINNISVNSSVSYKLITPVQ